MGILKQNLKLSWRLWSLSFSRKAAGAVIVQFSKVSGVNYTLNRVKNTRTKVICSIWFSLFGTYFGNLQVWGPILKVVGVFFFKHSKFAWFRSWKVWYPRAYTPHRWISFISDEGNDFQIYNICLQHPSFYPCGWCRSLLLPIESPGMSYLSLFPE